MKKLANTSGYPLVLRNRICQKPGKPEEDIDKKIGRQKIC